MIKTFTIHVLRNSSSLTRHFQTSKSILEKHNLGNTIKPEQINPAFNQPLSLKYYNQYLLNKEKSKQKSLSKKSQIIELDCPCMCNRLRMDPLCLGK